MQKGNDMRRMRDEGEMLVEEVDIESRKQLHIWDDRCGNGVTRYEFGTHI